MKTIGKTGIYTQFRICHYCEKFLYLQLLAPDWDYHKSPR